MENFKGLTARQAIEQGYEYYVYPADGYQALKHLDDDDVDFDRNPMIVEKEPRHPQGLTPEEIYETLADRCWEYWNELTSDDTDDVHDLIKGIDFTHISNEIQLKLNQLQYYRQSDVRLIKEAATI